MQLDICKYTNVKTCDEVGLNKRLEFLFSKVCELTLNQSSYELPIASDTILGGIKVGDGLIINPTTGVLSVVNNTTSGRFGIEDNLGSQDREIDMEGYNFEIFSQDLLSDTYASWFIDNTSVSLTANMGLYTTAYDILPDVIRSYAQDDVFYRKFDVTSVGVTLEQYNGVTSELQTFPFSSGYLATSVNNIVADQFGNINLPIPVVSNGVISGCIVTWLQDYEYNISAGTYVINGQTYYSPSTNITLSPSDPDDDRIDTFVVDVFASASVLEGTPSITPAPPSADVLTQLQIGTVLVGAATTSPTIVEEFIYEENTEWTTASSIAIDATSVSSPINGSVSIEATSASIGEYITFDTSSTDISIYNTLSFKIVSKGFWSNDKKLNLRFKDTGTVIGQSVIVGNGNYGFNSADPIEQIITIPLSEFAINANITTLEITVVGNAGTIGFFIDDIRLQAGIISNVASSNPWLPSGNDIYNTNTGNVGIGIIPSYKLHVAGTAQFGASQSDIFRLLGGNIVFQYNTLGTSENRLYSGSRLHIDSASSTRFSFGTVGGNTPLGTTEGMMYMGDILNTSGIKNGFGINSRFLHSSGTGAVNIFNINPIFNQSGGTPIVRGFYYNPSFTTPLVGTHYAWESTSGYFKHVGSGPDVFEIQINNTDTSGGIHDLLFYMQDGIQIEASDNSDITVSTLIEINPNELALKHNISSFISLKQGSSLSNELILYLGDLPNYVDNTAALGAGLTQGRVYRNGDVLQIVH